VNVADEKIIEYRVACRNYWTYWSRQEEPFWVIEDTYIIKKIAVILVNKMTVYVAAILKSCLF